MLSFIPFKQPWVKFIVACILSLLVLQVATSFLVLTKKAVAPPPLTYSKTFYTAIPHDICPDASFKYETELDINKAPVVFRLTRTVVNGHTQSFEDTNSVIVDKAPEYRNVMRTKIISGTTTYTPTITLKPGPYTLHVAVAGDNTEVVMYGVEFDVVTCYGR